MQFDRLFDENFIQVLILALFVLGGIAKGFYTIFIKPVRTAGSPPATPPAPRGRGLKEYLEELQRDLGHGHAEPRTGGLLEESREEPALLGEGEPPPPPPPSVPHRHAPAEHPPQGHFPPARRVPGVPARAPEETPEQRARRARLSELLAQHAAQRAAQPAAPAESQASPTESMPAGEDETLMGVDLTKVFVLNEVMGPPRCRGRHRIRR